MRIHIRTRVPGYYKDVLAKFERELFEALVPGHTPVDLVRFDGSHRGDKVHLRLKMFYLFWQDWISEITDEGENDEKVWFTDQGIKLPFFLSQWTHHHVVENAGEESIIIDDIEFKSPFGWLVYPFLYMDFRGRKPKYQAFFK